MSIDKGTSSRCYLRRYSIFRNKSRISLRLLLVYANAGLIGAEGPDRRHPGQYVKQTSPFMQN